MSVREYIGARYLPLFPDDPQWSITNTYEPLTVVQNLGSSYISRQYVPAGIQLSNTDYWVLWADFNSQIEQYRAEVQTFDGRITTNADDIDALEAIIPKSAFSSSSTVKNAIDASNARITTNAGDIDALEAIIPKSEFSSSSTVKTAIDASNARITALQDSISVAALRKEGVILLGDSYAQGVHAASATQTGNNWQDLLINRLGLTNVYLYKGGSAGFAMPSTSTSGSSSTVPTGTNYTQIMDYAYQYIHGLGKDLEIKHILVQGGVNDSNAPAGTSIGQAVQTFVSNVRAHFPNARIHICCVMCGSPSWQGNNAMKRTEIPRIYRTYALQSGASYNQCTNLPWLYGDLASFDGSHPSNYAQDFIAGFLSNVLLNGYCEDYSGTISTDGLPVTITKDHTLKYSSQFSLTTTADWSQTAQPDLFPTNIQRAFGSVNFDTPFVYIGADNAQHQGTLRMYVDGRIRWLSKKLDTFSGGYTGDTITTFFMPNLELNIGR